MINNSSKHHDSSLYYECLAKLILEQRINEKFQLLDKPDLQNLKKSIGVEVTSAFPKGSEQAISIMKSENVIYGKLREMGYENNSDMPGFLLHPTKCWDLYEPFPTFNYIIEAVKLKASKANNYKDMDDMRLFIITDDLEMDRRTLSLIVEKVIELGKTNFSYIYYQFLNKLLTIDIINEKFVVEEIKEFNKMKYEAIKLEEEVIQNV